MPATLTMPQIWVQFVIKGLGVKFKTVKEKHCISIEYKLLLFRNYSSYSAQKRLGVGWRNRLNFFPVEELNGIELEGNVQK